MINSKKVTVVLPAYSAAKTLAATVDLSEYHTSYRAFNRQLLEALPLEQNSDDFVFDNQMLVQAIVLGSRIGEISCPARYFPEASSINFGRSVRYSIGVLRASIEGCLASVGLWTRSPRFRFQSGRLPVETPFVFSRRQ